MGAHRADGCPFSWLGQPWVEWDPMLGGWAPLAVTAAAPSLGSVSLEWNGTLRLGDGRPSRDGCPFSWLGSLLSRKETLLLGARQVGRRLSGRLSLWWVSLAVVRLVLLLAPQ